VLAHGLPQRRAVVEGLRRPPEAIVQAQALEDRPPLRVRQAHDVAALDAQHIERDEGQRHGRAAHQDALAQLREVRLASAVERDKLAVEDGTNRQSVEKEEVLGHVPAATAANTERAFRGDDRPEAVPLQFVGVVAARR
jgi:hypothetical protein